MRDGSSDGNDSKSRGKNPTDNQFFEKKVKQFEDQFEAKNAQIS